MENQFIEVLQGVASGAGGTLMVVWFAWRRLNDIAEELESMSRHLTIIMTKMGVHDAKLDQS